MRSLPSGRAVSDESEKRRGLSMFHGHLRRGPPVNRYI